MLLENMISKLSQQDTCCTPVSTSSSTELSDPPILAIIGVGYVGEHLVYAFSSCFEVIGYDISLSQVNKLRSKNPQLERIRFTSNTEDLGSATHFLISVPTPLRLDGTVNLSHIESALEVVEHYARPASIVVIESTVPVGTTRRLLEPLARSRGLFAGMSPEVRPFCTSLNNNGFLISKSELIQVEFRLLSNPYRKLYLRSTMWSPDHSMPSAGYTSLSLIQSSLSANLRWRRW